MHFNFLNAGIWAAKAVRQLLRGRLDILYPCMFSFLTVDCHHTQILRWRGFGAHMPVCPRSNEVFGSNTVFGQPAEVTWHLFGFALKLPDLSDYPGSRHPPDVRKAEGLLCNIRTDYFLLLPVPSFNKHIGLDEFD